ncbi:hypothetical protein [Flavobacterium sp. LS1P3]|jgi:hypothetical protein|uniref:hypothetical protein n=1 Tax=Flavobacterium sp. LS1P3 TaxID=3401720 RepID=UPI003AABA3FF
MDISQNINFRLKNIEIAQSSLTAIDYALPDDVIFKFNINIEHLVNIDQNLNVIKPTVAIFVEDEQSILANLSVNLVFEIEDLANYAIEKEVKLPSDIIIAMNSISISTLRGIMFSTFKGTYLHNAILPVIDPKSFHVNK